MISDWRSLACGLLLSAATALGSPVRARSAYAVKDTHHVPSRWTKIGIPAADHMVRLTIGLKQSRFDELERHLQEVSDPFHHRYGQHLSKAEVDELVKPSEEALELVHEWLLDHDVELWELQYSAAKDFIKLSLPVAGAERLLDTKYSVFEHIDGTRLVRTPEYSLPIHLHQHVSVITPTNQFLKSDPMSRDIRVKVDFDSYPLPPFVPEPSSSSVAAVCNFSLVTPTCLRTIYGTLNYTAQVPGKNKVALTDYLGEVNDRRDVAKFLHLYRPEAAAAATQFAKISIADGSINDLNSTELDASTGIEGNLDAETILGISWPTPLTGEPMPIPCPSGSSAGESGGADILKAYSTGGLNPTFVPDNFTTTDSDEPYLDWVNYILGTEDIPQMISTSYGDDEQTVSEAYAVQVCNQFAQFGARGVSLLFASGDYGVGASGHCYSNDGLGTPEFLPSFPTDCPYVTVVGATAYYPEVAAYDPRFKIPFTSGAGFSNYFAQPSWQGKAVNGYITSLNGEYDGLYNKSGRAYPDIAALGQIFAVVWNGSVIQVDGTSAATPTAAGVLTLVNDALIAAGRSPLGFLNPWLYAHGHKAFTDVTSGSSAGCNTTGFPAKAGWDAVTGWGTPYFPDILEILGLSGYGGWKKE